MCWQCENPSRTYDDYLDLMRGKVDRYGWAVQLVESTATRSAVAYTVGLTLHGLPELVVTGIELDQVGERVNGPASWCVANFAAIPAGQRRRFAGGALTEAVEVTQPTVHLGLAATFYGSQVRGTQLVWQDADGRWPWDRGFRRGAGGQPVLGPRAARDD